MKKEYYPSLKLDLGKVSYYLQKLISEILNRNIVCAAKVESNDFWGVCIVNTRLSLSDLKLLLSFVNADDRTVEETMPEDAKSTHYLGMLLSSKLLQKALNASWKEEYVTEKALWLIDVEYIVLSNTEIDTNICFVCNRAIDTRDLLSQQDIKSGLETGDADYNTLVNLCEEHQKKYGDHLLWHYPISDGEHSGVYFVLVKEGVMAIPYNSVDKDCFEWFVLSDIKLCSHLDMIDFISEWEEYSNRLERQMASFKDFLGG